MTRKTRKCGVCNGAAPAAQATEPRECEHCHGTGDDRHCDTCLHRFVKAEDPPCDSCDLRIHSKWSAPQATPPAQAPESPEPADFAHEIVGIVLGATAGSRGSIERAAELVAAAIRARGTP